MRLSSFGLTVELPPGWEGAFDRAPATPAGRTASGEPRPGVAALPTLHLATFALPSGRGDFGSGAVELMRSEDAFVALLEYGPECVGTALFAREGVPRSLAPSDFHPRALQRRLPGQAGTQVFFTAADRAFCLYVVLGDRDRLGPLVAEVNRTLADVTIGPAT